MADDCKDDKKNTTAKTVRKVVKDKSKKKKDGFVDMNPTLDDNNNTTEMFVEGRSQTKIDYLIRLGLGKEKDKMFYYRRVIMDPAKAMSNPNLRQYVAEIMNDLLDMVFTDGQTYNRVRTLLQRDLKETGGAGDEGTDELVAKYKNDTPGQSVVSVSAIKRSLKRDQKND